MTCFDLMICCFILGEQHPVILKKDSKTRGHEVTLVKDQCRLVIRKYSFSQRTMNEWNKINYVAA